MKNRFMHIIVIIMSLMILCTGYAWADAAIGGEHDFQDADFYVVVDAPDGYVNFRYGPGLDYGIFEPIYNGEILHIIETAENYLDGLSWGQAEYNDYYGWVSLSQVTFQESQTEEPILPDYQKDAAQAVWGEKTGLFVSDAYRYMKTLDSSEYSFAIPRINMGSEFSDSLNHEIYNDLSESIRDSVNKIERGISPGVEELLRLSYNWYENQDILSLVLYAGFGGPWHEISALNISVSGEWIMNDREIYEMAGYSEEQYMEMVSMAMDSAFLSINEETVSRVDMSQDDIDIYNRLRNENSSEENLSLAEPFLNEKGKLCIVAPIDLFMMQNPYSWSIIDLETGEILKWKEISEDTISEAAYGDPSDYYVVVSAPDYYLNLRKGPGIAYDIITPVYNGEYLHIFEVSYNSYDDLYWGRTEFNGQAGWVSLSQASVILP